MKHKQLFFSTLFFFLFSVCLAQQDHSSPYLIVLSMDGFRWDYPDSFPTPNLAQVAKQGVKARSIIPSFPTFTFPNHYTLATGLYPDHHGIVHNTFYDPTLGLTYKIADQKVINDARFYGGEPIWVTACKQHIRTACFDWVGSEVPIQGMRPTYWKSYDPKVPFEQRIDTIISWLSLPEPLRPHLVMLYMEEPDKSGHRSGPFSSATRAAVMRVDSLLGVLINKTKNLSIGNRVNFIFTSDHGMSAVGASREVFLNNYIKPEWCAHISGGSPVIMIDPKSGCKDSIVSGFSKAKHLTVWEKGQVPQRLHFGSNSRIGSLIVVADSAYLLGWPGAIKKEAGAHGYDNQNSDMHAIFYAMGPAFKQGYYPSFENVNLYALMAFILKLSPVKTDGNIGQVRYMLK